MQAALAEILEQKLAFRLKALEQRGLITKEKLLGMLRGNRQERFLTSNFCSKISARASKSAWA